MAVAGLLYGDARSGAGPLSVAGARGVLVVLVVLAGVKYGVADTGFVDSVYRYV